MLIEAAYNVLMVQGEMWVSQANSQATNGNSSETENRSQMQSDQSKEPCHCINN